jgi:hypothetical protein
MIRWRRNADKYYHEWRTVLWLLALGVACCFLDGLSILCQIISRILLCLFPYLYVPNAKSWTDISFGLIGMPIPCLWCAVVLLALHRATARRPIEQSASDLPRISPAKFAAIWLFTAAVTVSGAVVLVWMSFGFWFNPWWRGR